MSENTTTRVAIIGGARTPFVKAGTAFKKHSALELAVHSVDGLLEKQGLDPRFVDELVYGVVGVDRESLPALGETCDGESNPSGKPSHRG